MLKQYGLLLLLCITAPGFCVAETDREESAQVEKKDVPQAVRALIKKKYGNDVSYSVRRIKLNQEVPSLVVDYYLETCGNGGCDADIIIKKKGKWRLVASVFGGVEPLKEVQGGWNNFAVYTHGGGGGGSRTTYQWDRSTGRYKLLQEDTYIGNTTIRELLKDSDAIVARIGAGETPSVDKAFVETMRIGEEYLRPPDNERLLYNYAKIAQYLGLKDVMASVGPEGAEAYPQNSLYQLFLAQSYADEGKPLFAELAAKRAGKLSGLSSAELKTLTGVLDKVGLAAQQERKTALAREVVSKVSARDSAYSLMLLKPGTEGRFDLAFISGGEIKDIVSFPQGELPEADLFSLPIKLSTGTLWPGPAKHDLASFAFRWETAGADPELHETTFLCVVDKAESRLFPLRAYKGFMTQVYKENPYLLKKVSWKIVDWPAKDPMHPVLREEYCLYKGTPAKLEEGVWSELEYIRGGGVYDETAGSGAMRDCPLGKLDSKVLW